MFNYRKNKNGHCQLCERGDKEDSMVCCEECDRWFHQRCVNLEILPGKTEYWSCPKCSSLLNDLKALQLEVSSITRANNEVLEAQREAIRLSTHEMIQAQKDVIKFSTNEMFKSQQVAMADLIKSVKGQNHTSANEPFENQSTSQTSDKLIKIIARQSLMDLPYFDGSYKVWPKFKTVFEETTKEGGFSDLENLSRLQKYLKGEALKLVDPLLLDQRNVSKIMQVLQQQFGSVNKIYDGLLRELLSIKSPTFDVPKSMIEFVTSIENLVINIKLLGQLDYLKDQRMIKDLTAKLPFNLQQQWLKSEIEREEAMTSYSLPTLETLCDWLIPHKKLATRLQTEKREKPVTFKPKERLNAHSAVNSNYVKKYKCFACNSNHKTTDCPVFKKMDVSKRREILLKQKVCFGCCNFSNHWRRDCKFPKKCDVDGCTYDHHPMLHGNVRKTNNTFVESGNSSINLHNGPRNGVFFQILPVTLCNGSKSKKVLAFLDLGSSISLVLKNVKNDLNIKGRKKPLTLSWTNGETQNDTDSEEISLFIKGRDDRTYSLKNVRTIQNLHLPSQSIDRSELINKYPYLADIDLEGYAQDQPTLLLGLPHAYLMQAFDTRSGRFNDPIANKTRLGWVLCGKRENTNNYFTVAMHKEVEHDENVMNQMMRDYFSIEDMGIKVTAKPLISLQEERALEIMEKTIKYDDDNGQYEIGLLWKDDEVEFPESYTAAEKRLKGQEKKMRNDPILQTWYINKIKEYEEKGYLRKLESSEISNNSKRTYYLPHFSVTNPNKIPLKPRLVFDAAAKVNGVSLNSKLLSGPDINANLIGVLVRFREERIAISGDIQEMFHQVKIRKDDQQSQRILFRESEGSEINVQHSFANCTRFSCTAF